MAAYDATVLIVTKDRRDDVRRAVRSAVAQDGRVEILVLDDGSTDGTPEALAAEFPGIRLERFDEPAEVVVRRNQGVQLASAEVVVGLDDDSELTTPASVARIVDDFDDPRVGAVAVPFVDLPQDESVRQRAPSDETVWATQYFVGASCALRRSAFLEVGGYRPVLEHQAEEPDLCIRLLAAGYVTRLGRSDPVTHYGSPRRSYERMWFRGARNDVLFTWHNVPMPYLPWQLAKAAVNQLYLGFGVGRPRLFARAVLAALALARSGRARREPVPRRVYRAWRRMERGRPVRLDELASELAR